MKIKKIGYAVCGSFCTIGQSLEQLDRLAGNGCDILPIMSYNAYSINSRFGKAADIRARISDICGKPIVRTITGAEPIGPRVKLDMLLISPCTGNTLAKLAAGITDTPVTMAAKAHMRNGKPLVIALATNDALSANLKNIGKLMEKKNVFFVPMVQDDPQKKPNSMVARFDLLPEAVEAAEKGIQLRPVFLTPESNTSGETA
ncbi:MAG: dipicolinate synthase subunit B [Clostridia bacterium]|nr:dipicolinate synthase subunit B [Clostridia bacterium]